MPNAAATIADALTSCPVAQRSTFLRELLAHTAAGLVIIDGEPAAAEAAYRLADAIVDRKHST